MTIFNKVIDNKAAVVKEEGFVKEIFEEYVNKAIEKKGSSPDTGFRMDIATGYFFFSGFKVIYETIKKLYDNGLLKNIKNNNWGTNAPIRIVMGKETDESTKEILLSIINNTLLIYETEEISFLRELYEKKLIEIRIFDDKKFHVKMYSFYFTSPYSDEEPKDVWIGSANISDVAMTKNIELVAPISSTSEYRELMKNWFTNLWKKSSTDLDLLKIIKQKEKEIKENKKYLYVDAKTFFKLLIKMKNLRRMLNSEERLNYLLRSENFSYDIVMNRLENYGGFILANSPGLGKTFVAAEAINTYLERCPDKKILVIVPPRIIPEWNKTIRKIVNSNTDFKKVAIISEYKLSRKEFNIKDFYAKYSLIVVDEAHHFKNLNINRRKSLENIITNNDADILLVTATPISLGVEDIINLIELFRLNNRNRKIFDSRGLTKTIEKIKEMMKNKEEWKEDLVKEFRKIENTISLKLTWRLINKYYKEDLKKLSGEDFDYVEPKITEERYEYDERFNEIFDTVVTFLDSLEFEPAKLWNEKGYISSASRNLTRWYKIQLYKRLESSLFSFYKSLINLETRSKEYLNILESGKTTKKKIKTKSEFFDDEDILDFNLDRAEEILYNYNTLDAQTKRTVIENIRNDIRIIVEERKKIEKIYTKSCPIEGDTKIEKLLDLVKDRINKGKKILIFSQWISTVKYIEKVFSTKEFLKNRVDSIHGETGKSKDSIIKKMAQGKIDVIIASDILSEGVNLPEIDVVINFDLPYNPVKLVQRDGRALRITHPKFIEVINFKPDKRIDKVIDLYGKLVKRVKDMMNIIGIDYVFWLIEEKEIKELSDREIKKYLNLFGEYKNKLYSENPENFIKSDFTEEDKLIILIKKAIEKYKINQSDIDYVAVPNKPFYTTLKGNKSYLVIVEEAERFYDNGNVELSFQEIKKIKPDESKIRTEIKKIEEEIKAQMMIRTSIRYNKWLKFLEENRNRFVEDKLVNNLIRLLSYSKVKDIIIEKLEKVKKELDKEPAFIKLHLKDKFKGIDLTPEDELNPKLKCFIIYDDA